MKAFKTVVVALVVGALGLVAVALSVYLPFNAALSENVVASTDAFLRT